MRSINGLIFFTLLSVVLFTVNIHAQNAEELYQKGVQLEEIKGELQKAIEVYSSIIKKFPANKETCAMAQLHIGLCYEKIGSDKLQEGIAAFKKVINLYPSQKEAVQVAKQKLAMDSDDSAIKEIKAAIMEWNKAYESKDVDKYCSIFSSDLVKYFGGIEKTKEFTVNRYFSKWKTISVESSIKSVDKTGYNYVVVEEVNITYTSWNNDKTTNGDTKRILTFTQDNGKWKLDAFQNQVIPAVYKKLNSNYKGRGIDGLGYVSHITQNFISVFNTKTDSLIGKINCGYGSGAVAFSSLSGNGYCANFNSNDVTVFNKKTNEIIATVPAGIQPLNIIVTPDGKNLLITHQSGDGLWVMSTKDNQIRHIYSDITGNPIVDVQNNKIYIAAIFTPYVHVLDADSLTVIKKIEVGGRPMEPAVTPDGKFIYLANYDLNEVIKIDTHTDSVVDRITAIGNGRGIAISPNGKYAYVTNVQSNTVTIIDLATDTVLKIISVGRMPTSVSVNSSNNRAYVSNQNDTSISVIDMDKNIVIKTINVADNPIRVQIF